MEKQIGPEAKLKLELNNGKLVVSLVYDGAGVDGNMSIAADGVYFCDELAKLWPGDTMIEGFVLGALKTALLATKI